MCDGKPRRNQRLLAWCLIAQHMWLGTGIPCPSCNNLSPTGDRFPCEQCGCGCTDAEVCWRSCCCFTNTEKVAWARKNGVALPAFVLAAAKRESAVPDRKLAACPCGAESHMGNKTSSWSPVQEYTVEPRTQARRNGPRTSWMIALHCSGQRSFFVPERPIWPGNVLIARPSFRISLAERAVVPTMGHYRFSPPAPPTPPPRPILLALLNYV
jgi:hypothetical protein